ncbi:iron reductase domain protein [Plenodomus tracheiphilus IPT5]|uniref:Iron reductase domain protein n=1 Tax=Plenodomus tracheiphilus IPT5 TaxID=1408161 RepID=A0A6A7B1A8_9PLEO|nr:iron reductase domain protein [Plenodomus tracheiphilus IPT5]
MRSHILKAALAACIFVFTTQAQISQQCVGSGVCYELNIPATTAQAGSGDIFFSITAPTTYSWVALGQGSNGMSNANVFMIYQDGRGNVTLSPRHSRGETMPVYDSAIDAQLLAGSGISNGVMRANVLCRNCNSWQSGSMDFTASSGGFIHARLGGPSLDSTDIEQPIGVHSTHGEFSWPFTTAVGGASTNPFQDTRITANTTSSTARGGGSSVNTAAVLWCHGIFASIAFVLLFPLGGILIRVGNFPGLIWMHAGLQMFAWLLFVTSFGLGLYYGIIDDYMKEAHPIIGIVLIAMMLFQPLLGWLHHLRFLRTGGRSIFSHGHIWIGRIAIILGMINGGLGMKLSGVSNTYYIVYSVFAGVFGLAYLVAIAYGEMMRKRKHSNGSSGSLGDREKLENTEPATFRRSSVG